MLFIFKISILLKIFIVVILVFSNFFLTSHVKVGIMKEICKSESLFLLMF